MQVIGKSRPPVPRRSLKLEAALVALAAANGVFFALGGSTSKAIDSAAWLVLLILFLAEAHYPAAFAAATRRIAIRAMRFAAALGVFGAALAYIFEGNALDAINTAVWIAVVVLLEAELRWPAGMARAKTLVSAAAIVLYGTLGALVVVWTARGEWLDAYDAALWLAAFGLLELKLIKRPVPLRS